MSALHHPSTSRRARSRARRSTLTTVSALVASATLGGATLAAEARPSAVADLGVVLTRTERMLGAWDSPQYVIEASHRARLASSDPQSPRLAALQAPGAQQAAPPPVFRFTIPQGPLTDALRQFEAATKIAVTIPGDLARGLTSGGVTGTYTAEEALRRLLAGSSLSHRFTAPDAVTVEVRVGNDTIEVSGVIPRIESTKYSAPLVETPQTIQIIPQSLIEEQGATTLSEALRSVPGITMQAGEGGGAAGTTGDMFTMRGFDAQNSLFVDGVRDDGLLSRDVFNLEQVEVFSGPTGSDVGRTNAAGYINMSTKQAGLRAFRAANLSYGSNDSVRLTADLNQDLHIGERGTFLGNAAVRVNVLWQDGGTAGRDYVGRESRAIAPSISFGLETPTRLEISGQIMRQDNVPDYGLPAAASPIGPLTATGVVSPNEISQSNFYGNPDVDYDKARQDSVTVRLEHDIRPGVTVRNQTRYNETSREAVLSTITGQWNAATNTVNAARQGSFRDNDIFSNQTSLVAAVSTGRLLHSLSLGLEFSSEDYSQPTYSGFGSPRAMDLDNPDAYTPVVGMDVQPTGAQSQGATDTIAFYLFDGVDLSSRVRLNGGVRVERYDTTSHSVNATGVVTDLEGDGTLVSAKAGLIYRLSNQGNLYLSYGSSLTPPGSTNFVLNASETNQNNPNVDPQKSTNYEVGTKWDLAGNRLMLSGAFFYTENTNVIFVVDNTTEPPIYNQDDGQRVRGVSLSAVGRPTSFWDLTFNVQFLDSERVTQNDAQNGLELVRTPPVAGSFWTTFRLPYSIRVGGGVRYTDRIFINTANTTSMPGYAIADALVEVPLGPRLLLRLNVNNITDKVYIRSINNNAQRYNPGTPRSFLLSTQVRF